MSRTHLPPIPVDPTCWLPAELWEKATQPFDLTALDVPILCDAEPCGRVAEWIVIWAMRPLACGGCFGTPLICAEHFSILADQLLRNRPIICKHLRVAGMARQLILRIEPL